MEDNVLESSDMNVFRFTKEQINISHLRFVMLTVQGRRETPAQVGACEPALV